MTVMVRVCPARLRQILSAGTIGVVSVYVLSRAIFAGHRAGLTGYPIVAEYGLWLLMAWVVWRWDERVWSELGGKPDAAPTVIRAFEWLGVLLGMGIFMISLVALLGYDHP